ncbi:zinc-finger associated domain (zf-AD) domain-containing protein [Phthorimaea operculella]|nr:zinc-finger associated domain (zf-AD) domain-containing protein [Phthorimaea operculella]
MWYLKACRSCLATVGNFERIGPQARRLFCVITGLQAEEDDGFPQYFCAECYVHIKKALQFRRRSRRAHFVLKEIQAIKKEVAQSEVEKVDRIKTNLISPYSLWKPEDTIFSYTTPDAIDPPVEITPDIESAMKESLNDINTENGLTESLSESKYDFKQRGNSVLCGVYNIQCNSGARTITINDITCGTLSESTDLYTQNVAQKPAGEMVKVGLETLNSCSILLDIKPDKRREIEREEEERKKRERQAEIDAAINEIKADDDCDDAAGDAAGDAADDAAGDASVDAADDDAAIPEDIDMEDIFKGLKEESVKESESEPELEFDVPKRVRKPPKKASTKEIEQESATSKSRKPMFLQSNKLIQIAYTLSKTKIMYMSVDEQKQYFDTLLNDLSYQKAPWKCGICVAVYKSVDYLGVHLVQHNEKLQFQHMCEICKDRFETKEELEKHASHTHWYKYGCPFCKEVHYTLESLLSCTPDIEDWRIKKQFTIIPQSPEEMYEPPKHWRSIVKKYHAQKRLKQLKYKCDICKIYFQESRHFSAHMEKHKKPAAHQRRIFMECDICHLKFRFRRNLKRHMADWHLFKFRCKICKNCFHTKKEAIQHLSDCPTVCLTCKKEFGTARDLFEHCKQEHKVTCNMCNHNAADQNRLLIHQLCTHGYIRLNTVPELNDVRYHCELCNIYFTEEKLLFQHLAMKKHPAADNYENGCKNCFKLFDSKEDVRKHRCPKVSMVKPHHRIPMEYPMKCPDCDEVSESREKFKWHLAAGCPGSKYATRLCETCGAVVLRKYYNQHKRKKHQNVIRCRFCSMETASATHHISHVLYTHTDRPYRCNICGLRKNHRTKCRDHILKKHSPVLPYACESCNRNFAHLDFLHSHCLQAHGVNLKKTDKSVYLSKRMFGKIYIYPDMKIDGSLLNLTVLEQTPVEICDYLDGNNKPIEYKDAFFFDPDVDPSQPTRLPPAKKINKKQTSAQHRKYYEKKKQNRLRKNMERLAAERKKTANSETNKMESLVNSESNKIKSVVSLEKNEIENLLNSEMIEMKSLIKSETNTMESLIHLGTNKSGSLVNLQTNKTECLVKETNLMKSMPDIREIKEDMNEEFVAENSRDNNEMETEELMGQLIEKDGEYFVLVDGVLYALENDCMENVIATGETQSVIFQ